MIDPHFRWTPAQDDPRHGVLGTVRGSAREFESIELEVGGDRRVLGATQRAAYEAYRIRHDVERGEPQQADVKADLAVVRMKNPFRDAVHAIGVKGLGRSVLFVRGTAPRKDEAALVRLVQAVAASAKHAGDDVDGWIPPEVKATWTREAGADLIVVDDGTVDAAKKAEIVKGVRDAHGVAKRAIGASFVGVPVVRITANRDLFAYLAGRGFRDADAVHLPWAAELLVCPHARFDLGDVAGAAARQACQHLLGGADGEPLATGIARIAATLAGGAPVGTFTKADEAKAIERVKARGARTWYRTLMLGTLVGYLGQDAEERAIDAELAVHYLGQPGSTLGRQSLAGYVAAFRKVGHVDAAAEAGVGPIDGDEVRRRVLGLLGPARRSAEEGRQAGPAEQARAHQAGQVGGARRPRSVTVRSARAGHAGPSSPPGPPPPRIAASTGLWRPECPRSDPRFRRPSEARR